MEGSKLGVLWKDKEKLHFYLFSLSFQQILIIPYFSLISRFYFTMVLHRYFTPFLPFPWPINCKHTYWCTNCSTHSLPSWFWLKIFSFYWIHDTAHDHVLWAASHTSEWRTTPRVIFRFDIDPTSSWWNSQTVKGAPSF